jgi:hypothetical protein
MSNSFLVNEDGTINIHYSSLNPRDVQSLIERLNSNLALLKLKYTDPIDVLNQSAQLNRITNEISFQLNWNKEILRIDLNNPEIPEPNIKLNDEQAKSYHLILSKMISRF